MFFSYGYSSKTAIEQVVLRILSFFQFTFGQKFSYFVFSRPETTLIDGLLPMQPRVQSNIPSNRWYIARIFRLVMKN